MVPPDTFGVQYITLLRFVFPNRAKSGETETKTFLLNAEIVYKKRACERINSHMRYEARFAKSFRSVNTQTQTIALVHVGRVLD